MGEDLRGLGAGVRHALESEFSDERRLRFIARVEEGQRVSDLAREFEISEKTAYKFIARWKAEGVRGLENKPRAAERIPHRTPAEIRELVLAMRRENPSWGGRTLKARLERKHPGLKFPSATSIAYRLKKHDLVRPQRRRRKYPVASPARRTRIIRSMHPMPRPLWSCTLCLLLVGCARVALVGAEPADLASPARGDGGTTGGDGGAGGGAVPDLSVAADLSQPCDLARPPDLSPPPDLIPSPDLAPVLVTGSVTVEIDIDAGCNTSTTPGFVRAQAGHFLDVTFHNRSSSFNARLTTPFGTSIYVPEGRTIADDLQYCTLFKSPPYAQTFSIVAARSGCSAHALVISCE